MDKATMTFREGRRALGEMRAKLDPKHALEVEAKLDAAEKEEDRKTPTP
jgi:hypothetical protein